jgi:hypothetical protein
MDSAGTIRGRKDVLVDAMMVTIKSRGANIT